MNVDDIKPKKDPRPGESLFKLRNALGVKIKENREKLIAQRLQEEKKEEELNRKILDSEDEEFDEFSDPLKVCTEPVESLIGEEKEEEKEEGERQGQEEGEEITAQEQDVISEKANHDENMSSEGSSSNSDSEEDLDFDLCPDTNDIRKHRKRILVNEMDDDSDNENLQPISPNSKFSEDL